MTRELRDQRRDETPRQRAQQQTPARARANAISRRRRHHQNTIGDRIHHDSQYTASDAKASGHGVT